MPSLITFPRGSRMDAATTTGHRSGRVTRCAVDRLDTALDVYGAAQQLAKALGFAQGLAARPAAMQASDANGIAEASMFSHFTPAQAAVFTQRFGHDDDRGVDFRRFSRVHRPELARRDFGFGQLLR